VQASITSDFLQLTIDVKDSVLFDWDPFLAQNITLLANEVTYVYDTIRTTTKATYDPPVCDVVLA
jgi:hypothetical protein